MYAGLQLARDQEKPDEQSEDEHGDGRDERKREADGLGHPGVGAPQRLEIALDPQQGIACSGQFAVGRGLASPQRFLGRGQPAVLFRESRHFRVQFDLSVGFLVQRFFEGRHLLGRRHSLARGN